MPPPHFIVLIATGFALALVSPAVAEGPKAQAPADRIARLIEQLGSESFAEREAATKALREIGEPALGALQRAAKENGDLEVQRRAAVLLKVVQLSLYREVACFRGHQGPVGWLGVFPDGRRALSAGLDGIRVWEIETGKELRHFPGLSKMGTLLPNGRHLLLAAGTTPVLFDLEAGKEVRRFRGHSADVSLFAVAADGHLALSGSKDGTARLWLLPIGRELRCVGGHKQEVSRLAFIPRGHLALSVGNLETAVRVWDVRTGKEARRIEIGTLINAVVPSPDGKLVATGGVQDGAVRLWETATGKEVRCMAGPGPAPVFDVVFSPTGRTIASVSENSAIRYWDVSTGQELCCFEVQNGEIDQVAFTPDGRLLLSNDTHEGKVRVWRLPPPPEPSPSPQRARPR